ncbi:MAG: UxaA family hydrolase [Defluviitaleaceae bacterium]|nr:UxaA family hydrolase [Defluviitaleaceae bacterium]
MPNALIMEAQDDVAMVTSKTIEGESVVYLADDGKRQVVAAQDIPVYHKIALRDIQKGGVVRKYGHIIGETTQDILIGAHVHTHNIDSTAKKE